MANCREGSFYRSPFRGEYEYGEWDLKIKYKLF